MAGEKGLRAPERAFSGEEYTENFVFVTVEESYEVLSNL